MGTVQAPPSKWSGLLWLDLTRKCQLACRHCYNDSGPDGAHGTMTREGWLSVLDQAAACGVRTVQLIGGEPTLHPDAAALAEHALNRGLTVEIFSNLVHVSPRWWTLFRREGVEVATSYYSDRAEEHDAMTARRSHARTRANIAKAVQLGVTLRVGIIGDAQQRIAAASEDLRDLGVTSIGSDHVRPFGRGGHNQAPDPAGLCGRCGSGRASVGPDGEVSPCVFSGWLGVGNVRDTPLATILGGTAMVEANAAIRGATRTPDCSPTNCQPKGCYPRQTPCGPAQTPCAPKGDFPPPCNPDNQECRLGTPGTICGPRR
ncbi:radical SAM protein [Streptomyces sp. DSM 44917]|uniref:Radical SAM protein n=1 Tax=Streptomyces boetiae TaxID=3075541 RepID=A0ABU2LFN6_9ACTN|nr:radical SAM protein [Streptomyces sp. DSM 44917]MDT0310048.1 radical SAM protein [Streptomyces sp. DSM 44917]